ncbi:hypothetical protein [Amycolatopsis alkalitolerans]|uniref:Uncharacterized protein n=1 Tax=Amycolatopsis alkalitolerans TaxID=2547244 RepID=A0A5C4LWN1_9PSEU|nr:hypothetical protein [Amycolatopsis alkalitolerans]TNC23401.1 hypothetical protein FG385_21940 [Amycolatopsis alkalitolerans]
MTGILKTLLSAAKLPASDKEISAYTKAYETQRASVDALYEVPAARYVDPALRFRAGARIKDWAS